jgi:hypothetical protein
MISEQKTASTDPLFDDKSCSLGLKSEIVSGQLLVAVVVVAFSACSLSSLPLQLFRGVRVEGNQQEVYAG